jgi:hypothetical protein
MMIWGLLIWQVFGKSWGLPGQEKQQQLLLRNGDDIYCVIISSGYFVLLWIRWAGHFLLLCGKVAIVWSFGVNTSIISFCFGRVVEDREGHFYLEEFESIIVSWRSINSSKR